MKEKIYQKVICVLELVILHREVKWCQEKFSEKLKDFFETFMYHPQNIALMKRTTNEMKDILTRIETLRMKLETLSTTSMLTENNEATISEILGVLEQLELDSISYLQLVLRMNIARLLRLESDIEIQERLIKNEFRESKDALTRSLKASLIGNLKDSLKAEIGEIEKQATLAEFSKRNTKLLDDIKVLNAKAKSEKGISKEEAQVLSGLKKQMLEKFQTQKKQVEGQKIAITQKRKQEFNETLKQNLQQELQNLHKTQNPEPYESLEKLKNKQLPQPTLHKDMKTYQTHGFDASGNYEKVKPVFRKLFQYISSVGSLSRSSTAEEISTISKNIQFAKKVCVALYRYHLRAKVFVKDGPIKQIKDQSERSKEKFWKDIFQSKLETQRSKIAQAVPVLTAEAVPVPKDKENAKEEIEKIKLNYMSTDKNLKDKLDELTNKMKETEEQLQRLDQLPA